MPEAMVGDYEEAREVVSISPRSACALLRLCVQKFCIYSGRDGKSIDTDIASMVADGLDPEVQEALDTLRVVGNESVHPGEMDLEDDVETATALFGLINYVIDEQIARPKKRKELYGNLPQKKRDAIDQRNNRAKGRNT